MVLPLGKFKEEYNKLIETEKKAEQYFDNDSVPISDREKWVPKFTKITEDLSKMIKEYETITGESLSDEVILNGF